MIQDYLSSFFARPFFQHLYNWWFMPKGTWHDYRCHNTWSNDPTESEPPAVYCQCAICGKSTYHCVVGCR